MQLFSELGYLTPTAPFDFAKSLQFLGLFMPMQNEQELSSQSLTKAVCIAGQTIGFQVTAIGTVEEPKLEYTLFSAQPIAPSIKNAVIDRISFFLSLTDELQPFYQVAAKDPHFLPILEQLYGYHQVKFLTPFENACWAVLSQRTPLNTARKMKQAIVEKLGSCLTVQGSIYWAFPESAQLAVVDTDELVNLIRNKRKAEYLSAVARAFQEVDEEFLRTADYEKVEAWLRKIVGIGTWSAAFILLRGLGRMEHVPLIEKKLVEVVSQVYGQGETMTHVAIQSIAQRYGACLGYWAHYLRFVSCFAVKPMV
ncbi:MAG: DNA-3-methyladenine glycosylase 2 family protein [Chroococcidiopsidaceae cyanobacterium CP_BM_ER_R8_30]|nr:DNA-3-methyladenine glycosylase 2 family protein [Chroococcidiopsidaceae cyanobacterium CP_BM_ER_R8_30]